MIQRVTIKNIYCMLVYFSLVLFFIRNVIPVNDLFWLVWTLTIIFGAIVFFKNKDIFNASIILEIIKESKGIFILLGIYIMIDFINLLYSDNMIISLNKYVIFVQSMAIFLNTLIMCAVRFCTIVEIVEKIYKWIFVSSVIIGMLVIINYFFPFMETEYVTQISLIADYNSFCRYFLFSYIVGIVYLYNGNFCRRKKVICISLYSILVITIVLMTISRRSLISLILVIIFLIVFIFISEWKKNSSTTGLLKTIRLIFSFVCVIGVILGVTYGSSIAINNISDKYINFKESRIAATEGRNSFSQITIGLLKTDLFDKVILGKSDEKNNNIGEVEQTNAFQRFETDIWGKRRVIWDEAINEIKTYNLKSLIFGKGAGYGFSMYEKEPHLSNIKKLYEISPRDKNFMYPHNYLLQDLLEGGLIKTIISFLSTFGLGVIILRRVLKNYRIWFIPLVSLILIATNIMISYSSGFIGDSYYNITIMLIVYCKSIENEINKKTVIGREWFDICNSEI